MAVSKKVSNLADELMSVIDAAPDLERALNLEDIDEIGKTDNESL